MTTKKKIMYLVIGIVNVYVCGFAVQDTYLKCWWAFPTFIIGFATILFCLFILIKQSYNGA